jgi:hypothetical protein
VDVAENHESEADNEMLRDFLRGQREAVLDIVEGLDEEAWHRRVALVPGRRVRWVPEPPGDLDEDEAPYDLLTVVFTADEPSAEVIAFYLAQCAHSEVVLAATPLSARPLGKYNLGGFDPPNGRWVVLHMIEETSRHAGHRISRGSSSTV